MILSVTFSKPAKNIEEILGKDFKRVKIRLAASSSKDLGNEFYFAEFYTEKQVFHKKFSKEELDDFILKYSGTAFKNCVERTETEEITIMASKKGKITRLVRHFSAENPNLAQANALGIAAAPQGVAGAQWNGAEGNGNSEKPGPRSGQRPKTKNINFNGVFLQNRKKNYILPEGKAAAFLVRLGIMTAEGKVVSAKYDKFRQINRFLEFIDDILPSVLEAKRKEKDETADLQDSHDLKSSHDSQNSQSGQLSVVDFGSGKSYLTFAVQYFLTEIKKIPCRIFGLDLKKDVIEYCSRLAESLELKNLSFAVGNIADFEENKNPDIVITLHACDTATDYALDYAVKHGAKAILSVPCCQHEINLQLNQKNAEGTDFEILTKYGLIKEKFSALLTDAVRGDLLEQHGYKVQMLEFIDDSATPKNTLIRAVKTGGTEKKKYSENPAEDCGNEKKSADKLKSAENVLLSKNILEKLKIHQTLEDKLAE